MEFGDIILELLDGGTIIMNGHNINLRHEDELSVEQTDKWCWNTYTAFVIPSTSSEEAL